MRNIMTASVVFLLCLFSCGKNTISENDILGGWEAVKGDYQTIDFSKEDGEYRFSTFQDGKPFASGTWSIDQDVLTIELSDGETHIFHDVSVKDGNLRLDGGKQEYRRVSRP